ncbi:MAG: hypothetical protein AAF533_27000, partial [Acidobacteriota bacterium]
MDREQRAHAIFSEAVELVGPEREVFLDEACGDDDALRAKVQSLLARFDSEPTLGTQHWPGAQLRAAVEAPVDVLPIPDGIGGYEIVGVLGQGGMGIVYDAWQPQPRRRVAIKIVRPGHATPGLLLRFRREVELLGRLQHPGVASILEADEGRPWGDAGPLVP